jgi:hypothetical protein
LIRMPPNRVSASPMMGGTSSPSRWSAGCIIATHDAQPERESRSHPASGVCVSCAHCAGRRRMPHSTRVCRAVGSREGPSSVRWVPPAAVAANISRRTMF